MTQFYRPEVAPDRMKAAMTNVSRFVNMTASDSAASYEVSAGPIQYNMEVRPALEIVVVVHEQ